MKAFSPYGLVRRREESGTSSGGQRGRRKWMIVSNSRQTRDVNHSPSVFLGIDGGGTRTRALLVDIATGTARAACGPSTNPHAGGFETAFRNLSVVLSELFEGDGDRAPQVDCAFAGIAGLRSAADRGEFARSGILEGIAGRLAYGHDAYGAWAGALACAPGLVVLCGTGSKVYGMTPSGKTVETGGFGFLLGDEGSAAWIGLQGLRRVVAAAQGRAPATALSDALLACLKCRSVDELPERVYAAGLTSRRFASLCPIVAAVAGGGDEVARGIFREGGRKLAELARAAVRSFAGDDTVSVSYQGSVFECGELILEPFRTRLQERGSRVALELPRFSGVEGSVLLAMRDSGLENPVNVLAGVLSRTERG